MLGNYAWPAEFKKIALKPSKLGKLDSVFKSLGLQIRVYIWKLFSLFLIQKICCGYSKEPSQ